MIEQIMYLAIGFLVSMLFSLMIVPLVHNRAVRLTTKRLEAATPLSMAEIQADKDQLRAEFAMSARRLEMSVDQLKHKTSSQFAELGKKSDAINRLKIELSEKNAAIFALEAREKSVREQLQATEAEFAARKLDLLSAEQALTEKQAELAKINSELADQSMAAETRQVELIAVRAQIDSLTNRVEDAEREFTLTQQRLERERTASEEATRDLAEARDRSAKLSQRVTDLDRQLVMQIKEAEVLGGRVSELQAQLAAKDQALAEREAENARLRQAQEIAERSVRESREEIAASGRVSPELDRLRAEKTALEAQLRAAQADSARLQRELNAMQQQTESAGATERMENALLRERINDIAAEVAKLAITLEGPDSAIKAMLAEPPQAATRAVRPANGSAPAEPPRGTLADRIRALQSHASRARQPV